MADYGRGYSETPCFSRRPNSTCVVHSIELLLLQHGKEVLCLGIVIATAEPILALAQPVPLKCSAKGATGKRIFPIGMDNCVIDTIA